MPVHVPLTSEAQAEARFLMLSANNLLKPADGKAVAVPTQDMILGSYYLTIDRAGEKGEGHVFRDMDEVFDFYTPVIAANIDYAKENPDTVKAFLRAAKKGYEYAVEHPSEAAEILCEEVPELDSALVAASAEFLANEYVSDAESWGVIDSERWSRYYQWLNDNELVSNKLDVNAGFDTSYLE